MFLFRNNAEPADDAGDHAPIDVTNAAHEEEHEEEQEEEQEVADVDEQEAYEEVEDRAEEQEEDDGGAEEHGEAPHTAREGTVPPLEERRIAQEHQHDVEAEEAAEASAAAPSHASAAAIPGIAMPRTYTAGSNGYSPHSNTGYSAYTGNVRRSSRGTTPRGTSGLSPRSHSRVGGTSNAGSALSAEEIELREQQYRRCSSVVQSACTLSERRASSVNQLIGSIDGGVGAARRRSGSMTAAEREAVAHMLENELHRQEAAERSAQFSRIRETTLVEAELAKEKASYDKLVQKEKELQAEISRRSAVREQRMAAAAQRRNEIEAQRQQAILGSVNAKDLRYAVRDPYTVVAAQRRYHSPVAPSRRPPSPGNQRNGSHASADYRRNSAPGPEVRQVKPGIDMSRPRQCLPISAWRTPEQQKKKARAGTYTQRCLPPGAWQAPTMADHPRQWH
jgi:hypothetical protein